MYVLDWKKRRYRGEIMCVFNKEKKRLLETPQHYTCLYMAGVSALAT